MSYFLINDTEIIKRLAEGYRRKRLKLNMTQETLAKKSNVSIGTIKKFEKGEATNLKTMIGILRALGEVDRLQYLIPEIEESPKDIFLREQESKKTRKRASREK